ncbi:21711_t:CDS:1, partial [Racocetra persica]
MNNKPLSKSWNMSKLNLAKQLYNEEKYKSAYDLFEQLTCQKQENNTHKEGIEIYGTA